MEIRNYRTAPGAGAVLLRPERSRIRENVAWLRARRGAAPSAVSDGKAAHASGFPKIKAISITGEEDVRRCVKLTCGDVIIRESGENH